ncbi:hypothetical protein [Empedobacter brevis]|uniref:hypothetical protein n=1 Tax=Empedobacter brevis TaxID=247 RepID=UPI00289FE3E6|nr:hypothetical protein [Empedobacter brevis]
MTHTHPAFSSEKIIQVIKQEIENHYSDKFTYAIPDWAMLSAQPEIISTLPIHGEEGIQIAKQKVDFPVHFSDISSIVNYSGFLSKQMNIELEIIGYVVFYNKKIIAIKAPGYLEHLTELEENELIKFNADQKEEDLSLLYFDQNLKQVNSLEEALKSTKVK